MPRHKPTVYYVKPQDVTDFERRPGWYFAIDDERFDSPSGPYRTEQAAREAGEAMSSELALEDEATADLDDDWIYGEAR